MAVGVPETDVFAAADAVLARGERPTVERVRLELGRGSPARVGGLLDIWWARLAERLSGETRLPALPAEVSQAFVQVWQQAIHLASGVAELSLSDQRQVVAAERERVAEVEEQARRESATFRQRAAEAADARQSAETRLADLELLLEHRQLQIEDLVQQRATLVSERDSAQQQGLTLQEQLQNAQIKAEREREAQEIYARGVEERAHREVDRAREENKGVLAQLKSANRQLEQVQRRLAAIQVELSQAEQKAAAQQARGDTLERQLSQKQQNAAAKRKPRAKKPV
ncbi:DNA-binding protein [Pseudomonas sp. GV071]|uniref:DNA-binding protein n=1 Tax=Pseudomonas sp. GV071 TaxID=2135754 RepID=UPI000D37B2D4|nr:DNA-binding protein [Pseudomonas sp. GV071]PTQ66756.1 plasmid replication DNA-binding protein KfrA [Pseudomonas sp. GV071]